MQTVVTERGQISIPAPLRKRFHLTPGTGVEWMETEKGILLLPVPKDPIKAFRGSGKTQHLNDVLLRERKKDKERENKKWLK